MFRSLFALRIVRAVEYHNDAKWNYPINFYPHHTVYFVLGGDGHVRVGHETTDLKAGHCYLLPANTPFSCWCDTNIHKLYVEFYLQSASGADVFSECRRVMQHPFSEDKTAELLSDLSANNVCGMMRFEGALMYALADLMMGAPLLPPPSGMELAPILADMEQHMSADLRIGDLARRHGWPSSGLSRAFVKTYGFSPKQYMNHLLVNLLKRDLLLTDLSLRELAARYKFCDAYYLSAFFKRQMGVSPQHYRQSIRKERSEKEQR